MERLLDADPEAVLDFARHFEARYNRAYTWELWGAAWVLLDGASDDAFDYFRCWLIGQGREVFEGALHEPDDLADLLGPFDDEIDGDGEELGYAADEAYEQLTGADTPDLGIAGAGGPLRHADRPGGRRRAGGPLPPALGPLHGVRQRCPGPAAGVSPRRGPPCSCPPGCPAPRR